MSESNKEKIKIFTFSNLLSYFSGSFGILSIVLFLQEKIFISIVCSCVAVTLDVADGIIARALNEESKFGALLDIGFDISTYLIYSIIIIITSDIYYGKVWAYILPIFILIFGVTRLMRLSLEGIKKSSSGSSYLQGLTVVHIYLATLIIYIFKTELINFLDIVGVILIIISVLMISRIKIYKKASYPILFILLFFILIKTFISHEL